MTAKTIQLCSVHDLAVPAMTAHAGRINDAHRRAVGAAKSMIECAIEAGNELLTVKASIKHGAFRAWCADNLNFSMRRAQHYMQLAKCEDPCVFAGESIEAAIRSLQSARLADRAVLTSEDAALILKLAAMTNGGNEHEEAVAREKLEQVAKRFGMSADEAEGYAGYLRPDLLPPVPRAPVDYQSRKETVDALRTIVRARVSKDAHTRWGSLDRETLLQTLIDVITEHELSRFRS